MAEHFDENEGIRDITTIIRGRDEGKRGKKRGAEVAKLQLPFRPTKAVLSFEEGRGCFCRK